ncbi:MAG: gamma carbonic anhydrase family protein [gamma proteobacterium endosymbiont of Lamellibrachia anaximandri]|nr:gamma carbonic anhydrase family protein [gamma proteobacterium endosymbiont of Lamellibrachia anaximandri]MBL3532615.1 gamma carbonic anhydrase family protein [gamma proteobacterium endosymbiont of Lamellibrachia anaximandri]
MSNIRLFESSMPQVANDAWIDETAVVIGNVSIGSHSSVWPMTVIRGDVHAIRIGMGCTILDGAVLESYSMLGAGSLVPTGKHLEGGYLWVGTPARRVRPLSDQELEYLDYSAAHYVRLMKRHTGKKW